ncbi:MAG: AraC family transcriptional regulator [Chitinophagaceae bacterium]
MSRYFQTITEENKLSLNKPVDTDVVYYSELNDWFTTNAFRSFSLKYVVDKCIHYKVGNTEHSVNAGHFLLACKQPHVKAYFDSKTIVKSVCIDICPATVAEAFTVMNAQEDLEFENYLARHFKAPEFFESVCPVGNTSIGKILNGLIKAIRNGEAEDVVNREWFLELIEQVVSHEYGNYLALNGLHSVKADTKKELLRRLSKGRHLIDENFLNIGGIPEIAVASNLSEFHFFRSFRQAFGITPYQYLLNKRLDCANELLKQNGMTITEISLHCNFPDLFTFSKAFKRRYGIAPSRIKDR